MNNTAPSNVLRAMPLLLTISSLMGDPASASPTDLKDLVLVASCHVYSDPYQAPETLLLFGPTYSQAVTRATRLRSSNELAREYAILGTFTAHAGATVELTGMFPVRGWPDGSFKLVLGFGESPRIGTGKLSDFGAGDEAYGEYSADCLAERAP